MENSMEIPQKTKNRVAIWSSNFNPGPISRPNYISKRYMHANVHSSTIHNSQDMETTQMSINRWMDKEDVVHIYNGILLSHKEEWNNAICSNMDGCRDYHTKWSKSEKEQIPYDITYVESKIRHRWTYLQNRKRLTDIESRLVVAKEGWGGMEWEFGISRCKLLYICIMESLCCIPETNTTL